MRAIHCFAILTLLAGIARPDEKGEARKIIETGIKAHGGKEKLAAQKATTFKAKGKFYGMGEAIDYTGDFAIQPPDKTRFQMAFEINAMKFSFTYVFDGKKGWKKINDNTEELDKDAIAEAKENMHSGKVESLLPLIEEKGFELSPVGEVKVEDTPAVGVRVSHKGQRDVNLFFDKKTGMLIKSERTVKDEMQGGKEMMQETLFSDYKEVEGVKHPMKSIIKRDGKKYVESEVSEYAMKDKIEDSEFTKP